MKVYRALFTALGVVCCALASEAGCAEPPAAPTFRQVPYGLPFDDGPPLANVTRGNLTWLGDFDKDGNFIRHPYCPPGLGAASGSLLPRFVWCDGYQTFVYEHRSGRLIKGTMVAGGKIGNSFCYVVPEIGSAVLDIKDVDLKHPNPDRRVWNMPEYMPEYVAARIRKYGDKPVPKAPTPPKAGVPAGWEFTPFSKLETGELGYKLKQPKPPMYARLIGDVAEFGHLSDEGDFVPDPHLPMFSRSGILGGVKFNGQLSFNNPLTGIPRYYTVPQPTKLGQERQEEDGPEEVYEFRSGRLIKGKLQITGNFVPELGSKILDFKDFDPNDRRRIYNLPGVLRKIEKK